MTHCSCQLGRFKIEQFENELPWIIQIGWLVLFEVSIPGFVECAIGLLIGPLIEPEEIGDAA